MHMRSSKQETQQSAAWEHTPQCGSWARHSMAVAQHPGLPPDGTQSLHRRYSLLAMFQTMSKAHAFLQRQCCCCRLAAYGNVRDQGKHHLRKDSRASYRSLTAPVMPCQEHNSIILGSKHARRRMTRGCEAWPSCAPATELALQPVKVTIWRRDGVWGVLSPLI